MTETINNNQNVLIFYPDECSGCLSCVMACSFEHYRVRSLKRAYIQVVKNPMQRGRFIVVHCAHCEYPVCTAVCPSAAIVKDEETGIVRINSMKCIGCKNCIIACPTSARWFDDEHKISVKCDLCNNDPKCVKACTTGALKFIPREEAKKIYGLLKANGGSLHVQRRK